jgi:hypothetical protein
MSQLIVCRNSESAYLKVKAQEAWNLIKLLDFTKLNNSRVSKCSLLIPTHGITTERAPTIEGVKTITLEDVAYRDVEISEVSPFTCPVAIGSLRHVSYKDGAEFVFRVVEMSDLQRMVSYELIETDSTVNVSSVLHTIQVLEITETSESVVTWTTEFSGDCDQHVYSDCKFKKLDAFQDMRSALEKKRQRE